MPEARVKQLYEVVRKQILGTNDEDEETFLLVTDLEYLESSIAGVATKILEGASVSSEDMRILSYRSLEGTMYKGRLGKYARDGAIEDCNYDLSEHPEFLEHARNIEELRKACMETVVS